MSPRRLITTADDFGASPEVNEAVALAFQEGVLRFASLMADGPAADEAAELAQSLPGLGVGVHLVLSADGPAAWGLRLLADGAARRGLESLLAGQIERVLARGLRPTHLDSHHNALVHPIVFPVVARLARRYRIGRIRWPGGELGPSLSYAWADWKSVRSGSPVRGYSPAPLLPQAVLAGVYGALGVGLGWRARGLDVTRAFGMLHSGLMTEDYVVWLLRRLPEGTTEMYFHPSSEPLSLEGEVPPPSHRSVTELLTLVSPRVRQTLCEERIELVSA